LSDERNRATANRAPFQVRRRLIPGKFSTRLVLLTRRANALRTVARGNFIAHLFCFQYLCAIQETGAAVFLSVSRNTSSRNSSIRSAAFAHVNLSTVSKPP